MAQNALEIKHINKSFPGVKALNDVTFSVGKGSIHALVGENGAGKSTLIKILAGIYHPEEGSIVLDGKEEVFVSPKESRDKGIRVVHQEIQLVNTLTVAENIFIGDLKYKGRLVDWKAMNIEAQKMLDDMGVPIKSTDIVGELTVAKQQIVEICKATQGTCKVLIMDEPTATITLKEQEIMFRIVRRLNEKGVTIIYISHRLEEIFDLADTVTVLRDGCVIKTLPVRDVDRKGLIALMVGRELKNEYPKEKVPIGEMAFEVKNVKSEGVLKNAYFNVHRGEIIGIAGLVGAGRTETVRAVLGVDKMDEGEVYLWGKKIKNNCLREAIDRGIGLIPESRREQGILPILSIKNNITAVNLSAILKNGLISDSLENKMADEYIRKLNVATPSREAEIRHLSGGNQQKVIIARWLMQNSDIIIMDEPTRGVDVGAKAEIYALMIEMVKSGKAIVMISSELPEILGMSDRIFVMYDGQTVAELETKDATQEKILSYCV